MKDAKIKAIIRDLHRLECEEILTEYGFQVYDNESTEDLREAIQTNYQDGTISGSDIVMNWGPSA